MAIQDKWETQTTAEVHVPTWCGDTVEVVVPSMPPKVAVRGRLMTDMIRDLGQWEQQTTRKIKRRLRNR